MTRWALLWGGPMDGERVFIGAGDLPARIGMHRTADDCLVVIRSRALQQLQPVIRDHVTVYEHLNIDLLRAWRAQVGDRAVLFANPGVQQLEDVPLYLHRDLATRWLAAPP